MSDGSPPDDLQEILRRLRELKERQRRALAIRERIAAGKPPADVTYAEPDRYGVADWLNVTGARLGQGVLGMADAAERLANLPKDVVSLAASRVTGREQPLERRGEALERKEEIERILPRRPEGAARIIEEMIQSIPALLVSEGIVARAAPGLAAGVISGIKGVGARAAHRAKSAGTVGAVYTGVSGEGAEHPSAFLTNPLAFALLAPALGGLADVTIGRAAARLGARLGARSKAGRSSQPPKPSRPTEDPGEFWRNLDEFADQRTAEDAFWAGTRGRPGGGLEPRVGADELSRSIRGEGTGRRHLMAVPERGVTHPPSHPGPRALPQGDVIAEGATIPGRAPLTTPEERAAVEVQRRVAAMREAGQPVEPDALAKMFEQVRGASAGPMSAADRDALALGRPSRIMGGETGAVPPETLALLLRGGIGGLAGSFVGDTPEERRRNAALIGLGFAGGWPVAKRVLAKGVKERALSDAESAVLKKVKPFGTRGPGRSFGEMVAHVYENLFEPSHAAKRLERTLTGSEIADPAKSLFVAVRATQGSARRAEQMLEFGPARLSESGTWVPTGNPGITEAVRLAGGSREALNAYQIAARTLEVAERGKPTGVPIEKAARVVAEAGDDMARAHQIAVQFDHDLARYLLDAGFVSQRGFDGMIRLGQAYVHLARVFETAVPKGTGKLTKPARQVHRFKGSERDIIDPFDARIERTARIVKAADRNRAMRILIEMSEQNPDTGLLQPAGRAARHASREAASLQAAARAQGADLAEDVAEEIAGLVSDRALSMADGTVAVWRNGQREVYRVHPTVRTLLDALEPGEVDFFSRQIGSIVSMFKAGVTLEPGFGPYNMGRDAVVGAAQSRYGVIPFWHSFLAFVESANALWFNRPAEAYQRFARMGGGFASLRGGEVRSVRQMARHLEAQASREARTLGDKGVVALKHPIEALKLFARPFEEAGRFAEAKRAFGKKASDLEAFMAQQDATVNFQEMGPWARTPNQHIPFLNPALQGLRLMLATLGSPVTAAQKAALRGADPLKAGAKKFVRVYGSLAASVSLPSAYFWYASLDDEEVRDRQRSAAGMIRYFFRLPDGIPEVGGKIGSLPKSFGYGTLFDLAPILDIWYNQDPEAAKRWMHNVWGSTAEFGTPIWYDIPMGIARNKDPFFGTPIDPPGLEGVEPKYRASAYTGTLAQRLAEALPGGGVSPSVMEWVWGKLTGTLGRNVLDAVDMAAQNLSLDVGRASPPAPELADYPVAGRFFGREGSAAVEPIQTFYENYHEIQRVMRSHKLLADQGREDEARRIAEKNQINMALLPLYQGGADMMSELRDQLAQVIAMPDSEISREDKLNIKIAIQRERAKIAREINEAVNEVRRGGPGPRAGPPSDKERKIERLRELMGTLQ